MIAIILAAGAGIRLRGFTDEPKCLIKIEEEPLIVRTIELLKEVGIKDITVVAGYKANRVISELKKHNLKVRIVHNEDFKEGSIISLWKAIEIVRKDILIIDSDVYFEKGILSIMTKSKKSDFFLIDSKAKDDAEAVMVGFKGGRAIKLGRGLEDKFPVLGEWAGFLRLSGTGVRILKGILKEKISSGERSIGYEFVIPELFDRIRLSYELIDGLKWVEIDFVKDVMTARRLNLK